MAPDMIDPTQFLSDWDRTHEYAEARREDMFMVASPFDGMPWMEAIAGCEVYVSLKSRGVWAEHPEPSWDSLKRIRFDPKISLGVCLPLFLGTLALAIRFKENLNILE